jgi:type II secretory pathway pseudopilin PulG
LSAIALPSFLSQANKAKQSEAKTYIGSLNKAQQAFYVENTAFSSSITQLGVGIQTKTTNYEYKCEILGSDGVCKGESYDAATSSLRSYAGLTYLLTGTDIETTTTSIICETNKPTGTAPGFANNDCTGDSSKVGT